MCLRVLLGNVLGFVYNGVASVVATDEEHEAVDHRLESEELGEVVVGVENGVEERSCVYYGLRNL